MRLFRRNPGKRPVEATPTASVQQKRAALASHRELRRGLEELQTALQDGPNRTAGLESLLNSSIHHWEILSEYLSATIQPRYYNEVIPPQSTAAKRTSAVPELFEMITEYLNVPSILALASTCREYKTRIDNSPRMQTALCLRPAPAEAPFRSRFKTCLSHMPGGGFYCKSPILPSRGPTKTEDDEARSIEIGAGFFPQGDDQRLPRVGAKWRRMFITQPPVMEITARVRCCGDIRVTIEREQGITIGDLYDTNAKYIEEHRWCPHEAHGSRMLENGQVQVLVDFSGKATLRASDPMITKFDKELAEKEAEQMKSSAIRRRNATYRYAKRIALDNRLPVPTMPEWLETNSQWRLDNDSEVSRREQQAELDRACVIPVDAFSFN